jgi:hypothetical protein
MNSRFPPFAELNRPIRLNHDAPRSRRKSSRRPDGAPRTAHSLFPRVRSLFNARILPVCDSKREAFNLLNVLSGCLLSASRSNAISCRFPVIFSVSRENDPRRVVRADCIAHHSVCGNSTDFLVVKNNSHFRGLRGPSSVSAVNARLFAQIRAPYARPVSARKIPLPGPPDGG